MRSALIALAVAAFVASPVAAQVPTGKMGALRPDQQRFLELYKELVETNTTLTDRQLHEAAAQIAARLKAAGFADEQTHAVLGARAPEGGRAGGGLSRARPARSKPILLLGHIDVVEAKREDWMRDPFTLVEENGYFYARGIADDKMMAATWADTLIRLKQEGYSPQRTVKLALTCGEETDTAFNGAQLAGQQQARPDRRGFALNEGGGGDTDGKGHSSRSRSRSARRSTRTTSWSRPTPADTARGRCPTTRSTAMSDAAAESPRARVPGRVQRHHPRFFARAGAARRTRWARRWWRWRRIRATPRRRRWSTPTRDFHSMLRTTCVATLIDGGHADNALPQRVEANVNCRIFPGHTPAEIQATLAGSSAIRTSRSTGAHRQAAGHVARARSGDHRPDGDAGAKYFPGVPVIPAMSTGATDGLYFGGGHPDLRRAWHVGRSRRQRRARPQRTARGAIALRRARLPVRPGEGVGAVRGGVGG